jgi:RNA 2',3'-cyclic 3'-phosphodiesterase
LRLFTAIDVPEEVKKSLAEVRRFGDLKWTRPEKLHLTIKFIGEWPEERLGELKDALTSVKVPSPDVAIRRVGWLPNPRRPQTLYAGVEASKSLVALHAATEEALEKIGIAKEKRIYRPHVTLARIREKVSMTLEQADFGSYQATSFGLYLSADGKYTKLQEFPLGLE